MASLTFTFYVPIDESTTLGDIGSITELIRQHGTARVDIEGMLIAGRVPVSAEGDAGSDNLPELVRLGYALARIEFEIDNELLSMGYDETSPWILEEST